jgi:hypothetical protein
MQQYVQPGAVRNGVFGGFGAYVQPGAMQNGIFGGLGADLTPLTQTVDGLTFMTPAALALWQSAQQLSACPVAAPTTDIVVQIKVDPSCQSLAQVLAAAPPGAVVLVSPADLMTLGSQPAGITATITTNPAVVAQLAKAGSAFAIVDTAGTSNTVVASAKTIAKAGAAGGSVAASVAAHGTGLLIAVGVGALVIWAFAKKGKR